MSYFDNAGEKLKQSILVGAQRGGLRIARKAKEKVNVDTAHLKRSITSVTNEEGNNINTKVGTNVEYGPYQEFGNTKFPGTPYLRPAMQEEKGNFTQELIKSIKDGLRG